MGVGRYHPNPSPRARTAYRRDLNADRMIGDALALATAAGTRHAPDLVLAAAWIAYAWRRNPDDYEQQVRDAAVGVLCRQMSRYERVAWRIIEDDEHVDTFDDARAVLAAWDYLHAQDDAA